MRKVILINLLTLIALVFMNCSGESKKIERPDESSQEHHSKVREYDSKVASIMRTIRKHKKSESKMTESLESNLLEMFKVATTMKDEVETITDDLSLEDYKLLGRSNNSLREKEMEFESLRQNK